MYFLKENVLYNGFLFVEFGKAKCFLGIKIDKPSLVIDQREIPVL